MHMQKHTSVAPEAFANMSEGEDLCWVKVKIISLFMTTGISILIFSSIDHPSPRPLSIILKQRSLKNSGTIAHPSL